ncbi:glutamate--cysteine ligase regulatory subunit-like [Uloborus diversus]|uniref:glutamate--cysteine ligase regulatory subunit-like n=1 Tax=Uloborus diversus TaxID=327109 RepID=UPI002409DA6B|nr:glutamate--cysteine ligase regulatory subunit-like [Uloborus diversus]
MQSPSEEVFDSVHGTLHPWIQGTDEKTLKDKNSVYCFNEAQLTKVDKEDRVNLKVSVKVFLENFECEDLKSSLMQVMDDLDVSCIDSMILSVPQLEKFDLNDIKPLWTELERWVQEEKLLTIGISDLDTDQLAELYHWTQVKPSVNQVNLESCCVMPPEMTAFAKDNDIQLFTHNDPKVLLPREMLLKILEPAVSEPEKWKADWIVRYSVLVKTRGIIQNKGYTICFSKKS